MSAEELIDLAKALSPDEQLQLLRAVEEDRFTKLERQSAEMIPPGTVVDVGHWHFETTPEGMELMRQELERFRASMK